MVAMNWNRRKNGQTLRSGWLAAALALGTQLAGAQSLDNKSLTGKYFARHLMLATDASGAITDARTLYGAFTFDGAGGYTFQGSQILGTAAPASLSGSGTYSVKASGYVTLANPQKSGVSINAALGVGALAGSTTESAGVYDIFFGVPAPAAGQTNASLNGAYSVSTLEFPGAALTNVRNASIALTANGAGILPTAAITGHAANLGDTPIMQLVSGATYSIVSDGSGTASIALPAGGTAMSQLWSGTKAVYLSADGKFLIGGSNTAGGHDIFIGTRAFPGAAANTNLAGRYFSAGMRNEAGRPASFAGSGSATGAGKIVWSRRVRQLEGVIDLTGVNSYIVQPDGTGTIETKRLLLGVGGDSFTMNGVSLSDTNNYEIAAAVRMPAVSGTGVYINPQGVVNAASFAPAGAPISPGCFVTIFGSGLAAATATAAAPFPKSLGNVQLTVNGTAAALYVVSPGQISALVPFGVTGSTATLVVTNGGARSNSVDVPLAKSSPGIFTGPQNGLGAGAILHADFSLVTQANPAKRNEVVQLFLTGLGAVTPAVPDGVAAPGNPLSLLTGVINVYVGGKQADVLFKGLAPGLAGLYQINFRVPATSPTGGAVPLAIETPEAFHDQADIAVLPQ